MSEFKGIEISTSQQNPTEIPGGLGMPYQIPLSLTGLFITVALITATSISVALNNRARNAQDKKIASIQERLTYIQSNYSKRVENKVYNYYDPKIKYNPYLTDTGEVGKLIVLKTPFKEFLNDLITTSYAEYELNDDLDMTCKYYKKTATFIVQGKELSYMIDLEYISFGYPSNTTNWIVSLSDNKNT
jgi:hypothetical protein